MPWSAGDRATLDHVGDGLPMEVTVDRANCRTLNGWPLCCYRSIETSRSMLSPNCRVSSTLQDGFDPYERNWHQARARSIVLDTDTDIIILFGGGT